MPVERPKLSLSWKRRQCCHELTTRKVVGQFYKYQQVTGIRQYLPGRFKGPCACQARNQVGQAAQVSFSTAGMVNVVPGIQ